MTLTIDQQRNRFGMAQQDAHRTRDLALQSLTPSQIATARAAWADMAALTRNSARHPEMIRFYFLSALANGLDVADAERQTLIFASTSD
jgi:hypothetical protein